jgi:aminoglycoside phosphotransferase (APT) family kinase protein
LLHSFWYAIVVIIAEFVDTPDYSRLYESLDLDSSYGIEQISGGFTASEKYVILENNSTPVSFAKLVRKAIGGDELAAMHAEIRNYKLLDELHLTGSIYPRISKTINTDEYVGIMMDYYADSTWGGPWTKDSILAVHELFSTIHTTALTDAQRAILQKTKNTLIPMQTIYQEAFPAFRDRTTVINSRGHVVFSAPDDRLFRALFEDEKTIDTDPPVLIAQDANKHNICIDRDGNAHIVDPVYINIGNPYQDLLNIGRDIIQSLPPDAPEITTVKELFQPNDKHNRYVLDAIAYGLLASQKPYDHNPPWMDYQEEGVLISIKLWYDQI